MTDLNLALRQATQQACGAFSPEREGFKVDLVFELDESVGDRMLSERDFGEAVLNLVSNVCFAMQQKRVDLGGDYQPRLTVASQMADGTVVAVGGGVAVGTGVSLGSGSGGSGGSWGGGGGAVHGV